jgi:hypothetical protein
MSGSARCSCSDSCDTTELMAARHGTPAAFRESVFAAVPAFVSYDEAYEAATRYAAEWDAVARNDGLRSASMKLVIIESPYKGDVEGNLLYLRYCIRDCIARNESPYASHRMLTDGLDDNDPEELRIGIAAGLAWRKARWVDDKSKSHPVLPVFYLDLGWSEGMLRALELYESEKIDVERRYLSSEDLRSFLPKANT